MTFLSEIYMCVCIHIYIYIDLQYIARRKYKLAEKKQPNGVSALAGSESIMAYTISCVQFLEINSIGPIVPQTRNMCRAAY